MKTVEEAGEDFAQSDFVDNQAEAFNGFMKGVEFAQRWIPVEEEFPEFGEDVLVKDECGEVSVAFIYYGVFYPNRGNLGEITHWRPIENN